MEKNTASKIEQRIAQLPHDVQEAVLSVEWEQKVRAIGAKHGLHIDQIGALGDTTLMAMIGLIDLTGFPDRIARDLGVDAAKAAAVAGDINNEVFLPIRESLKTFSAKLKQDTPPLAPTPVNSAPSPSAAAPTAVPIPAATTPVAIATKPDLAPAEALLSQKTMSTAPAATAAAKSPASAVPAPKNYSSDPYREPPMV